MRRAVLPVYGLFKSEIHDDTMSLFLIDQQSFGSRVANDSTFFLKDPDYVYKR